MPRGIEAKLQDKLINLLKRENILYIKSKGGLSYLPNGKGGFLPIMNKKGFADVIVFTENVCCVEADLNCPFACKSSGTKFIEVKTDTSALRDSQIEKFKILKSLGYECFILRPKHWEKAKLKGKLSFENVLNEMERY